jgi:hypothetical protein
LPCNPDGAAIPPRGWVPPPLALILSRRRLPGARREAGDLNGQ